MATGRLEINPDDLISQSLNSMSVIEQATIYANQFLQEIDNITPEELIDLAKIYYANGDYETTLRLIKDAKNVLENSDESVAAKHFPLAMCYTLKALCLFHAGLINKALVILEIGGAMHDDYTETRHYRPNSSFHFYHNRCSNLIRLKQEHYKKVAKHIKIMCWNGNDHALDSYQPILKSCIGLGLALYGYKHGKPEEQSKGLSMLKDTTQLFPINARDDSLDWAEHCCNLGAAYSMFGMCNEAFAEYRNAQRIYRFMREKYKFSEAMIKIKLGYVNSRIALLNMPANLSNITGNLFHHLQERCVPLRAWKTLNKSHIFCQETIKAELAKESNDISQVRPKLE